MAAAVVNNPIRVPLKASADRDAIRFGLGVKIVAGDYKPYGGEYTVIPDTVGKILETKGYFMEGNVNVLPIPYAETSNLSGGYTATIGG